MKQLIITLLFTLIWSNYLSAQQWWSRYTKKEREILLVEKAKQAIVKGADERYYTMHNKFRIDSIMYKGILGKLQGRELYYVYFLYDSTQIKLRKEYLSLVRIIKDNGDILTLSFGNGRTTSANPRNKVAYEEIPAWEIKMSNFLSVYKNHAIDTFQMIQDTTLLSPFFKVEVKQLIENDKTAKLICIDNKSFIFPLVDKRSRRCAEWLQESIKEKMPVLISLVKGKDNVIGQVKPPIKEIGERFKARSKQNE